jgi:hypothetical protein
MLRAVDLVAWVFPFFGAILVLRGDHVLFIAAGSVAGCAFERVAGDIRMRVNQDRKIRQTDSKLIARLRALDGVEQS